MSGRQWVTRPCGDGGILFWQRALIFYGFDGKGYHRLTGFVPGCLGHSSPPQPEPEGGKGGGPRPSEGWRPRGSRPLPARPARGRRCASGAAAAPLLWELLLGARPGPRLPRGHGAGGPGDRAAVPRGEAEGGGRAAAGPASSPRQAGGAWRRLSLRPAPTCSGRGQEGDMKVTGTGAPRGGRWG